MRDVKAAFASIVSWSRCSSYSCSAPLGIRGGRFVALLATALLSIAFAVVAVVASTGSDLGSRRRLTILVLALPVLLAFMLAIVAMVNAFDDAFN